MRDAAAWLELPENPHPTSLREATFSRKREKGITPNERLFHMSMHARKTSRLVGRYSSVGGLSGLDLPREGKRAGGKIEIAHGHEVDPSFSGASEAAGKDEARITRQRRSRVAINAQTDALEYEARRGRISAAAYEAGRYVDRVLEAASGRRTGREFGEADRAGFSAFALQQALVARIDAARKAQALKDAIVKEIGPEPARVIVKVIGESLSFRMIARIDAMAAGKNREAVSTGKGRDCERAARAVAGRFRDGLEALAVCWKRRGKPV
jgi:hypothetical protein